jgi:hypothetical protein
VFVWLKNYRYHFFFIPKKEQSYQLLQIAIGMCIDMGLHLPPSEATSRKIGLRLDHYMQVESDGDFFSKEGRRAYLGCYYLSTKSV